MLNLGVVPPGGADNYLGHFKQLDAGIVHLPKNARLYAGNPYLMRWFGFPLLKVPLLRNPSAEDIVQHAIRLFPQLSRGCEKESSAGTSACKWALSGRTRRLVNRATARCPAKRCEGNRLRWLKLRNPPQPQRPEPLDAPRRQAGCEMEGQPSCRRGPARSRKISRPVASPVVTKTATPEEASRKKSKLRKIGWLLIGVAALYFLLM